VDGRLAIANSEMLAKIRSGKEENLKLTVSPKEPASAAEIRKLLGI
jgi:hypothetical protein